MPKRNKNNGDFMKSTTKKSTAVSFVEGKAGKRSPAPKSLTPKVKASGDKKRAGVYGKAGPY